MATKLLSNNPKDPSLSFEQPAYSGFQTTRDSYAQNSFLASNVVKAGLLVGGVALGLKYHNKALNNNPNYLAKLNKFAKVFEDRTPYHIGRTFGISDRLAGYNAAAQESIHFPKDSLFSKEGTLSPLGRHFQRLFNIDDPIQMGSLAENGLTFKPTNKSSRFIPLEGRPDIRIEFGSPKGQLAAASYKNRNRLAPTGLSRSKAPSLKDRVIEDLEHLKTSQMPVAHPGSYGDSTLEFLPINSWHGANEVEGKLARGKNILANLPRKLDTEALALAERGQKLFAETLRMGVRRGSYNRAITMPFFAKAGESGLINELMVKRVLPIYLGYNALKYVDYLTGHKASNTIVDAALKVNVARAELTDRIPGARKVTDFYENTVPGAQYAPLALPAGGAFLGAMYHYGKVALGKYGEEVAGEFKHTKFSLASAFGPQNLDARRAGARLLPDLSKLKNIKNLEGLKVGIQSAWKSLGAPGKGLAIGLAAALPFIPGMLGSRKNAAELRDIYSGEEDVPIRSGRWWSLGCQIDTNTHLTDQGIKTVKEIYGNKDLKVLNDSGTFETPNDWMRYKHKGPVYKISLNYSDTKLSFTPNHLFPVRRDNELLELRADELQKGDFLLTRKLKSDETKTFIRISDYIDCYKANDKIACKQINWFTQNVQRSGKLYNNSIICDYDFGFLLGHFMAEGSLNSNERGDSGVEHTGDLKELDKFNTLNTIYEKIFGFKGSIKTKDQTIKLRVSGNIIARFFRALLFKNNIKLLSYDLLIHLPKSCLKGILEGWFYGDGCLEADRASIKTKYKENALILKKLFSTFDVASSITYHESRLNEEVYPGYKVSIQLEALQYLEQSDLNIHKHYCQVISDKKAKSFSYQIYENEIAYRIKAIEIFNYDGFVYDFEVSSNHHYETETCITHNSSAFGGGRITAWRKHWSLMFKARSKEKSLWGDEKTYWKNNPIFHPINALANPYALENQNYDSRPYPITSPAGSNIPLIGPLFAATIGRLIKPVKRMHEDQFDDRDYHMYSTRLDPKGPQVESKFERDVLQQLSQKGYKAETQVKAGDYRLDFVLQGEKGQKLAIETDGDTYHTKWNAKADAQRDKTLRSQGWDILHVRSGQYFDNPNKSIESIVGELNKRGIKPTGGVDRDTRSGLVGLAPPIPKEEFGLWDSIKEEGLITSEFVGLPGYVARTLFGKFFPDHEKGQTAYLQGSRQMDSLARSYYETNLGEGLGPNIGEGGTIGYTEPIRRFIQRDPAGIQANDIPNTMPSWLPGEDYLVNFKTGDPYIKVDQGYGRLPGPGYEALNPELDGINPENYPDITKLRILADVAPYSREFNIVKDRIGKTLGDDTEARIRYEKILDQAKQAKESILNVDKRHFTGETETIDGTIKSASVRGVELAEYPGRVFKYSSLGTSAAELSAVVLGQHNNYNRTQVAEEVRNRQAGLQDYIADKFRIGTSISATVSKGAADNAEHVSAVFNVDGDNINKELIDKGYAQFNKSYGGAETSAIFGRGAQLLGEVSERLAFDVPKYVPTPYHTKLWQERTAYDQYVSQEVVGTRMRRWDRPFDDFASPYARGLLNKLTGIKVMSDIGVQRRDLNTLADQLKYLRALHNIADNQGDEYTRDTRRTNIGTNLLASPIYVASTIPDRDKRYFQSFLAETDPSKRVDILAVASPEMAKTLQAQWAAADARIAKAEGYNPGLVESQGRLVTDANLDEYNKAQTKLGYGDYLRSKEVADFFSRTGFTLPEDENSPLFANNLDYEDVKLKIIQNEGYDAHDFNIFDDRTAMLWRKPYVEGAVVALTSGETATSSEQIRRSVEQLMISANNKNPNAQVITQPSQTGKNNVKINIDIDDQEKLMKDIRRNPDDYKN